MVICPSCAKVITSFKVWSPKDALCRYYYGHCDDCRTVIQIKEEELIKVGHWMENYTGKYSGMELIDRKQLMKDLGYDKEENIEEDFNEGMISEETTDILSFIKGAKVYSPVDIVLEYEKNIEDAERLSP